MRPQDEFERYIPPQRQLRTPLAKPYLLLWRRSPAMEFPFSASICSGQTFRRSTFALEDFTEILLMRYPVRCLRCSQRQMVSFTVASLALSSAAASKDRRSPTPSTGLNPARQQCPPLPPSERPLAAQQTMLFSSPTSTDEHSKSRVRSTKQSTPHGSPTATDSPQRSITSHPAPAAARLPPSTCSA